MSGGVDSSVAASLTREAGLPAVGVYMKNWINEENIFGDCPWQQDIEDALKVANQVGIEFEVVNLMNEYRSRVVEYLLRGYEEGITPNPDVMCNREMKFGVLLDYALQNGFTSIATGHYARRRQNADGSFDILEGIDKNKDQSYFLALLSQNQVAHARFPVGEMWKPEVRAHAEKMGLYTSTKKDSQGICFIGKVKMSDFLKTFLPDKPGSIVDSTGRELGIHKGLHFYTLGQRKGIRVPSNKANEAYVVVEKRQKTNELVLAFDRFDSDRLYAARATLRNLSFTNKPITEMANIQAKPRYRAAAQAMEYRPLSEGQAEIIFKEPQRALTPGQICALYDGEVLLGGGVFDQISYGK